MVAYAHLFGYSSGIFSMQIENEIARLQTTEANNDKYEVFEVAFKGPGFITEIFPLLMVWLVFFSFFFSNVAYTLKIERLLAYLFIRRCACAKLE